jgi:low temperature requirement protein LtrA
VLRRDRGQGGQRVTSVELFFDLVSVLAGPALFLAGHALFKRMVFGRLSVARLLAMAALACLWPLGTALAPLLLISAATLVVAAVAVSDTRLARAASPG